MTGLGAWARGAVLAVAATLAGCGMFGDDERRPPCPRFLILSDGGELVRFAPGAGRDITDVEQRVKIIDFRGTCEGETDRMSVTMTLDFHIDRGPANRGRRGRFDYFVAIPQFYPAKQGKRTFTVDVPFEGNQTRLVYREELEIEIPIAPGDAGKRHEVYIALQLTPAELEFNRRRHR